MKEYVFKISVIDVSMKVELPSINLNNDSTLPDLMAALTFEFIESMVEHATENQQEFMEQGINNLRKVKILEALDESKRQPAQ